LHEHFEVGGQDLSMLYQKSINLIAW